MSLFTKLVSFCLLAQVTSPTFRITQNTHPSINEGTTFNEPVNNEVALDAILNLSISSQVPLGVVLGNEPNPAICRSAIDIAAENFTLKQLIDAFNKSIPGYTASLDHGVLNILPTALSNETNRLLNIKTDFRSYPDTQRMIGSNLWMFIRAVIAPGEGTISGGFDSISAERVPGPNITNQSVKTILNTIIDEGGGGVWILYSSKVNELSSKTPRPYEIFGYHGEEQSVKSVLKCK